MKSFINKTVPGYNDNLSSLGIGLKHVIERDTLFSKIRIKICGIYKIINKTNGKLYVGGSIDFHQRKAVHKYQLKNKIHSSLDLQKDFDLLGLNSFLFILLEKVPEEKLISKINIIQKRTSNIYLR